MKLPQTLFFLGGGWWAVHLVAPAAILAGGIALGSWHASGHGADGHAAPPPITGNPLRDEMIALHEAFDALNAGLVLGQTEGIEAPFHAVHARREATAAALAAGTVRPPQNADQMEAFVSMDDAFHGLVEAAVDAARRKDLPALRVKSGEMLDACVACHATFRDPPDPAAERLAAVKAAVPALGGALKTRLQAAMAEGEPDAAVRVCADEAQEITRKLSEEQGVTAGRSSLRLRNPANAAPAWVAAWLAEEGERPAAGVEGFARIDTVDGVQVARVLKPIPVEPLCLTCHGAADALPEPVRATLAARYPEDRATGYAEGDLRGAIWAEAAVSP